jgi:uracil phosphoribosyltransferase/phosphoserine phosphatase/adenylate kinase
MSAAPDQDIDPCAKLATVNPRVVGIYGISGSGKSHLLKHLEKMLGVRQFKYYDGSSQIEKVTPGGLLAFQNMGEIEQVLYRKKAIISVQEECKAASVTGIVAGHLMFWNLDSSAPGKVIWTDADAETYTQIIYLDVPARTIQEQRVNDQKKLRPVLSEEQLRQWMGAEISELSRICFLQNIALMPISGSHQEEVLRILGWLKLDDLEYDFQQAARRLDNAIADQKKDLETIVVLDADKTLAPKDTGEMFWEEVARCQGRRVSPSLLKNHFKKHGQTHFAFSEVALLYEDLVDENMYEYYCNKVAGNVDMYPEFVALLKSIDKSVSTGAVVITCGLRKCWEKILEKVGLQSQVKVIGGGRLSDGCVISAEVKTALVARLKRYHNLRVWAIGDSPLDLGMMKVADRAIVVVGEKGARSTTMDQKLSEAIKDWGLRAQQVVFPPSAEPRLTTKILPITDLKSLIQHTVHQRGWEDRIYQATNLNSARLLMTPMRNADNQGPTLCDSHHSVGRYLATQYLGDIMGLEAYDIPHVQGNKTTGFRFAHEKDTLIVALMRAGEPLAFGINAALPLASFLHAKRAEDIKPEYVKGRRYIILADGVINSGATVVEFLRRIYEIDPQVRIIVVAGVTQARAVVDGALSTLFKNDPHLSLVTLRMSENSYKGKGGTDTGHRLFNTTFLE